MNDNINPKEPDGPWWTTAQAAPRFGVKDPKTIRNWINHGIEMPGKGRIHLKAEKLGRSFRIHIQNLERFEKHFI